MNSVSFAVHRLSAALTEAPVAAIVLGSGLAGLADALEVSDRLPFDDIPDFPRSTATGHKGEFVVGRLSGQSVVALNGRLHAYEGYASEQIGLPIRVMHALGAKLLIVSNATGGLNPLFAAGDLMAIESHLDLMFRQPGFDPGDDRGAGRPARIARDIYDPKWLERCRDTATRLGIPLHHGVYVGLLGPNYETRAEYRFLRRIGGDVVGMSTVAESRLARELGMSVLGLSVVTNVARPDRPSVTSAEEVIAVASAAEARMQRLVEALLTRWGQESL